MPEREKGFQAALIEMAEALGWKCYHTYDSRRSEAGFPDLVLAKREQPVIFAELKTRARRPSDAQRDWLDTLAQAQTTEVYVWYPADWAFIEARLRRTG